MRASSIAGDSQRTWASAGAESRIPTEHFPSLPECNPVALVFLGSRIPDGPHLSNHSIDLPNWWRFAAGFRPQIGKCSGRRCRQVGYVVPECCDLFDWYRNCRAAH
jgi:hypothetical protein